MLERPHEYPAKAEPATVYVNARKQKKQSACKCRVCLRAVYKGFVTESAAHIPRTRLQANNPVKRTNRLNGNGCSTTTDPQSISCLTGNAFKV